MLLDSEDFLDRLSSSLAGATSRLVIASAYIKLDAFKLIAEKFRADLRVQVVSRWELKDLVVGVSDLEVYELCKESGWEFGINSKLHGKLFLIDDNELFLGSANLTKSGLNLKPNANLEFGTKFTPRAAELEKLGRFVSTQVRWIDDERYELMFGHIQEAKEKFQQTPIGKWPAPILHKLLPKVEGLWLTDLLTLSPIDLLGDPSEELLARDFKLLNLSPENLTSSNIKDGFRETAVYAWAVDRLSSFEAIQFGRLKQELDNSVLDDPRVHRKELTPFLDVLFSWFIYLGEEFEVSDRSHGGKGSRTVRLRREDE